MARQTVDHYIPFFGRDFLAATAGWTAEERGHYVVALVVQWEQGSIPDSLERLEMMSPGISASWAILAPKFPLCEDGRRRNPRMEVHRAKSASLKEARSESGQSGNRKRWSGSQTDRKLIANGDEFATENGIANGSPPTPTPTPTPDTTPKEENSHTHTACGDDFRQPGWAAGEWAAFVEVWNATERAARWEPLIAPSAWVDHAASPGWLERARAAVARLPGCRWFETPLAVTRFFEYVDRILAGEFDNPKQDRSRPRQRVGGNL